MSTAQEQIDQAAEILKSTFEGNCCFDIQSHSDPNHLIVFLEDQNDGSVHQLLLGITYIGQQSNEDGYTYDSEQDCRKSGNHLTDCDDDGYCNLCGSQEPPRGPEDDHD